MLLTPYNSATNFPENTRPNGREWRASAIAVIKRPSGGKALIIYDPNFPDENATEEEPARPRDVLSSTQQALYAFLAKNGPVQLWRNSDDFNFWEEREEQGYHGITPCCKQLQSWMEVGDVEFIGAEDPRLVRVFYWNLGSL